MLECLIGLPSKEVLASDTFTQIQYDFIDPMTPSFYNDPTLEFYIETDTLVLLNGLSF